MWIADQWKDYEVLDTSSGEKLERWGDYLLVRPDPQVIWNTPRKNPGWKKKNVHTLEDVRLLDAEHKKRQLEKAVSRKKQPAAQSQSNNRFNNFHQRDYDFTEYEKRLLNNQ